MGFISVSYRQYHEMMEYYETIAEGVFGIFLRQSKSHISALFRIESSRMDFRECLIVKRVKRKTVDEGSACMCVLL